jgi:predicted nuclease with TOPRIM domain
MNEAKQDTLAHLKKQARMLQIKKNFLMGECQKHKDKLDEIKRKVNYQSAH